MDEITNEISHLRILADRGIRYKRVADLATLYFAQHRATEKHNQECDGCSGGIICMLGTSTRTSEAIYWEQLKQATEEIGG